MRQGKADGGDLALIVADFGNGAEDRHGDKAMRDRYHRRALALAAQTSRPVHFHLSAAVRSQFLAPTGEASSPAQITNALGWQHRFPGKAGQAYLLSFVASALAINAPDEAMRMADTFCDLVRGGPDEYACRLRDRGVLLRKCGRPAESVRFLDGLTPQDEFRAGLKHLDIAKGLVALGDHTDAHARLQNARQTLQPYGYAFYNEQIASLEQAMA